MIQIWQGNKFDYEHEINAQRKIITICKNHFDEQDAHLIFSFKIQNVDFDCAIFTKNRIIILELKKFNGFISGNENGHWLKISTNGAENKIIRNKNPFEQCSICRSTLNKEIRSYAKNKIRTENMARLISSGIISYPKGYPRNDGSIEKIIANNPWFFYENIANLKKNVLEIKENTKFPFSHNEIRHFILKHLNCNKEYFDDEIKASEDNEVIRLEKICASWVLQIKTRL